MHPIIALACPGAFRYFASWHTPLSQAAAEECGTHQRHCVSVVRAPAERVEAASTTRCTTARGSSRRTGSPSRG